jgi:hypothetical protein
VIWKPLCDATGRPNEDEREYAEVAFVPTWIGNGRKDAPAYRFLAIREPLRQLDLPHITAPTPRARVRLKGLGVENRAPPKTMTVGRPQTH